MWSFPSEFLKGRWHSIRRSVQLFRHSSKDCDSAVKVAPSSLGHSGEGVPRNVAPKWDWRHRRPWRSRVPFPISTAKSIARLPSGFNIFFVEYHIKIVILVRDGTEPAVGQPWPGLCIWNKVYIFHVVICSISFLEEVSGKFIKCSNIEEIVIIQTRCDFLVWRFALDEARQIGMRLAVTSPVVYAQRNETNAGAGE